MTYLKILLMRHAESLGNLQGQMEGQRSTALSPQGHQQAHRLAEALIHTDLPTHLYSSPLLRATQTTDKIMTALQGIDRVVISQPASALTEIHQGIFQGLTWQQAQAQHPEVCAQLLSSLAWKPVPEAESLMAARHRAQQWINHILSSHQPGDTLWAVSHAGILQQMIAVLMGCDRTWKIVIAHTAIFEFWLAQTPPKGQHSKTDTPLTNSHWQHLTPNQFNPEYWQVRRFNDSSHLAHRPVT